MYDYKVEKAQKNSQQKEFHFLFLGIKYLKEMQMVWIMTGLWVVGS